LRTPLGLAARGELRYHGACRLRRRDVELHDALESVLRQGSLGVADGLADDIRDDHERAALRDVDPDVGALCDLATRSRALRDDRACLLLAEDARLRHLEPGRHEPVAADSLR